jgi:hypothetical protein
MATITDNRTGTFTANCPAKTKTLLVGDNALGLYLQAKMGQVLGKKPDEVLLGTPLKIPGSYANSEGVIPAMEGESGFVKGLRIDLQKAQVINGVKYATFQIQWGTGMGSTGGAYAGALLRTDTLFSVGDLRDALIKSFGTQSYWRIDP